MNLVRTGSPNLGSGKTSRLPAARRRDMTISLPRTLRAVFRTALTAVLDTLCIKRAADDVVTHPRQILDPPTADQHHRVLLQVMTLAWDVACHLVAVGQANAR